MSSDAQTLQAALVERAKPVKLQVNIFASTWKDVVKFDAADDAAGAEIMEAAATLARHSWKGRSAFRIATDDPMQPADVLLTWSAAEGWKEARHA